MALQRLPSLGRLRLVSPRPYRQLRLPALRCSAGQQGDEELPPSEDMSNMLRSFGSRANPPPAAGGGSSSSSNSRPSTFKGFGQPPKEKPSATEALLSSLGGVSEAEGRRSMRNNIVLGADDSEESWRELDSQVNEYPGNRTIKAIGSGGQEFAEAMRACAEKVVGPLHEECVSTRPSSKGNYLSVTLSFWVETPEQVRAVYNNMREDPRLRYVI